MMIESAPGNEGVSGFLRNEGGHITEENLQLYFGIGLQCVVTQAEYRCPMKYSTWSVTTWCKKLNYNYIMKKGSDNDKELVEESNTLHKNTHKQKRNIKQ